MLHIPTQTICKKIIEGTDDIFVVVACNTLVRQYGKRSPHFLSNWRERFIVRTYLVDHSTCMGFLCNFPNTHELQIWDMTHIVHAQALQKKHSLPSVFVGMNYHSLPCDHSFDWIRYTSRTCRLPLTRDQHIKREEPALFKIRDPWFKWFVVLHDLIFFGCVCYESSTQKLAFILPWWKVLWWHLYASIDSNSLFSPFCSRVSARKVSDVWQQ